MSSRRPSLRFFHPAQLRIRTNKVLTAIEQSPDPTIHAESLSELVVSLTEAGIDYYFLKAMREAKLSYISPGAVEKAVAGGVRALAPIVRSVLGKATASQIRVVAKHVRGLMA